MPTNSLKSALRTATSRPSGPSKTDAEQGTQAQDIHVELPCVEGLLAGTLALMTGYSQKSAGSASDTYAPLMAQKIASNLQVLKTHPCLSLPFATVLANLERLWADLARAPKTLHARGTSMWHGVAASVQ
jgi:hypothetical protein